MEKETMLLRNANLTINSLRELKIGLGFAMRDLDRLLEEALERREEIVVLIQTTNTLHPE